MIDQKTVQTVAHLARLEFSQEEETFFMQKLNGILKYMEKLNELDTSDIAATSHVAQVTTPMREDQVQVSQAIATIFEKDAPDHEDHFFRVPQVL